MTHIIWILLSFFPSAVWLTFFYRKDINPEPFRKILKIFFGGMFSAFIFSVPIAIFFILFKKQILTLSFFKFLVIPEFIFSAIIFAPIIEEVLKYLAIVIFAMKDPDCDEPTDLMIYAITTALGFAALENILYLFPGVMSSLGELLGGSFERLIGATLFHALVSGLLGYFIVLSAFHYKKRRIFIFTGLILSIILHSTYNSLIILSENRGEFLIIAFSFLTVLFIALSLCFRRAKKMQSICKI